MSHSCCPSTSSPFTLTFMLMIQVYHVYTPIMICAFECVRVGPIAVRFCLALTHTRLCPLARTRHASTRTDARLHADANSRPCARAPHTHGSADHAKGRDPLTKPAAGLWADRPRRSAHTRARARARSGRAFTGALRGGGPDEAALSRPLAESPRELRESGASGA